MAKQYCRYCIHLCVNRGPYCDKKQKFLTESACKRVNTCVDFELADCPPEYQDAFMENAKGYHPRKEKAFVEDGQLRLDFTEGV